MFSPVFLPALLLTSAWAQQVPAATLEVIGQLVAQSSILLGDKLDTLLADSTLHRHDRPLAESMLQSTEFIELLATVVATKNATSQLQIELDTLRGRQAASAAVQASQVLMLVVYFVTILSIYLVKRCQEVREKAQQKDFELLEKQLRSSRAKRRAAAAKEKSAPAASLE